MQFCKQDHIGYASFCNWRKRLSDPSTDESSGSAEAGFLDVS
ncbi:IS66 family insertion sequence element accessory protein TnpA [Halioxenophilus aromaticivorans]